MKLGNLLALVVVAGVSGAAGFYFGMERDSLLSTSAEAPESKATDANDKVVATVDGSEIRESDVRRVYDSLPPQYKQAPFALIKTQLVEQLVNMRIIQNAAKEQEFDKQSEFSDRVADVKDQLLQEYYIQKKIDAAVTEDALKAEYDKATSEFVPAKEVHARHILLENEEKAKEVIELLEGGGNFIELAKEHSTGPSGPNGGDLGYFEKERMVPEFAEAAFAMEVGSFSKEPVQTQFGWHVIYVEDSRDTSPPAYDDMKETLKQTLTNQTVNDLLDSLKEKAVVNIVEGAPSAEAPAKEEGADKE
ncbi:peptidylprolyl isomerase [Sneathiella glossodoripedis]|uniref:peptidylprolyl isomerase n=1 Tax=Sneathiella glossodoripedis TaxID=418853 RepID=UPI0004710E7A|nr:peptidylprolyl isomerase [Sneathiella glossodoripedis]